MFNLKIICLGKLKEAYWRDAEAEYFKRLRPYAKIELIELTEESFHDTDDKEKIRKKEAEKIVKHVSEGSIVIALHERGKAFTSPDLSKFLDDHSMHGDEITFIIGGPLGLHESILKQARYQISLSPLTFPHQMVRTILAEQLYRAATILQGKQYHY